MSKAEIVICGAGIAGVALGHELVVGRRWRQVVIADGGEPLSLTSDKSTECYRNWWPGPDGAMVQLMNRSIDRLEALAHESGNAFRLNRRGYVYATADAARAEQFRQAGEVAEAQGAGPLRCDDYQPAEAEGFAGGPDGADLLRDRALIRRYFPYLSEEVVAVIHARRCGWFSSTELGTNLLEQARAAGLRLARAPVTGVDTTGGQVRSVRLGNGEVVETERFVNCAGPLANEVARLLDLELPIFCERHAKLAFHDTLGVVPREAPLLIWGDPQRLAWTEEEREALAEDETTAALLGELPAGAHTRPEGGGGSDMVLMLWAYDAQPVAPTFPPEFDEMFPEVVVRGLETMLPGLRAYLDPAQRRGRPMLDGGYYVKTRENRPLVGALEVPGAYVLGALSGYGLMAACGAAALLADELEGRSPAPEAEAFRPVRYENAAYRERVEGWEETGQL